ncbi:MAG: hypothetical protein ACOX33_10690 [Dethiobacteria bacterium]
MSTTNIPFMVGHHRRFSAKLNMAKEIIGIAAGWDELLASTLCG